MKSRDAYKNFEIKISGLENPRKGKDMTTVRFAYCHTYKYHYESLSEKNKEWSGFIRSFKVRQSQRITV